jgi:crossover junction endodeoxyribonuclease RuvC
MHYSTSCVAWSWATQEVGRRGLGVLLWCLLTHHLTQEPPSWVGKGGRMRILGVDPGLTATGYAVLDAGQGTPVVRASGLARSRSRRPLEERIREIYDELAAVVAEWRPGVTVMEYGFPKTAILMGHVRGAICLASAQHGARVLEVSPAEVKNALTGSGRASKEQIQRAVTRMLRLREPPRSEHVSDALALALVGAAREGATLR